MRQESAIERCPMRERQRAGTDFIVQRLVKKQECPPTEAQHSENGTSEKGVNLKNHENEKVNKNPGTAGIGSLCHGMRRSV